MNTIPPIFWIVFAGIFGMAFGSFGSVLICRLPKGESISGRSHCPLCEHTLAWYDLFPVISYLSLRGQCRYCTEKISSRYPLLEVTIGIVMALLVAYKIDQPLSTFTLLIASVYILILIGFFDFSSQSIPNFLLNILCLLAILYQSYVTSTISPLALQNAFLGATVPFVFFGLQWLASRGEWIGSGDILLGVSAGLLLGFYGAIVMLFLSYIIGAAVAITLLMRGSVHVDNHIAFGPFLCIATIITVFLGDTIVDFYAGLYLMH